MSGRDRQRDRRKKVCMCLSVLSEAKQISCTHSHRPAGHPLSRSVACTVHLASSVLDAALYTAPLRHYTYTRVPPWHSLTHVASPNSQSRLWLFGLSTFCPALAVWLRDSCNARSTTPSETDPACAASQPASHLTHRPTSHPPIVLNHPSIGRPTNQPASRSFDALSVSDCVATRPSICALGRIHSGSPTLSHPSLTHPDRHTFMPCNRLSR